MQKFSEFLNDYKAFRKKKDCSPITAKDVKKVREAYEALVSKKPVKVQGTTEKVQESISDEAFEATLSKYREWKQTKHGERAVTLKEKENLKKAMLGKLTESKEPLKESEEDGVCPVCGKKLPLMTAKKYLKTHNTNVVLSIEELLKGVTEESGAPVELEKDDEICEDCFKAAVDELELKKDEEERHEEGDFEDEEQEMANEGMFEFEESIEGFKALVGRYREWKKDTGKSPKLTENEKKILKAKFLERCGKLNETKEEKEPVVAKNPRLEEAIAQYKEWKKAEHNDDEVTAFEEATIAKNLVLDDIAKKLQEAKSFVESGKKHLAEGDMMDAGADANAAAGAVADATAMGADPAIGGDPNAMAADPNVAGAALPQNIVDEISQIKTSIDTLATEVGIESPVDLGADANAGVPAVTGATDPNVDATAPVNPNANAVVAAPMPESIKSVKARIAERNNKIEETVSYSNTKMVDDGKDAIKTPTTQELVNGTKSGIAKAAEWPIEKVEPKDSKKLKNVEASQEELAKKTLDESGEFSWANYTKMLKNM